MSLFGKKKRSLDDILQDIQALSEEEQAQLRVKMQGEPAPDARPEPDPSTEAESKTEESSVEDAGQTESADVEPQTSDGEPAEPSATEEAPSEEAEGEPAQEEETAPPVPAEPLDTPQPEERQSGNSDELYAALQAKYDSLESQFKEMQATLEKIVAKQDNQNFGYSPKANFEEEGASSRMDGVLNGYAPRRADQYK